MASSPGSPSGPLSFKKHSSRSKKTKHTIADSSALERRSWEAWGQREECIFFDSLVRNSRNWGAIASDIGSKRSEQVRLIRLLIDEGWKWCNIVNRVSVCGRAAIASTRIAASYWRRCVI